MLEMLLRVFQVALCTKFKSRFPGHVVQDAVLLTSCLKVSLQGFTIPGKSYNSPTYT
jgi:hypothetical protein